ncbi:MAG: RNA methyltransferase [Clostridia bacterium]|nr:RNA methyltransferase [Clostridia bacterium]
MANIIEITDRNDPALDLFRRSDAQLRMKQHPDKAMFVAESAKVVKLAMDAGIVPAAFLMERKHITGQAAEVLARCPADVPVYTGDRDILGDTVGYYPDRCIQCIMPRPKQPDVTEILKTAERVAVVEAVTDTTNVGAVIRSAAALGMDAVLLTPTCCDPLNRRSVRVSMGTVFQLPWARIGNRDDDWPEKGMALLKAYGFTTAALALKEDSVTPDCPELKQAEKLALILGTEGDGLTRGTIARCDHTVMIPMSRGVDSLNVAAAGAVAFWALGKH